jgi:hypothetical protein
LIHNRELRWRGRTLPPEVAQKLSPAEQDFFKAYDRGLNEYCRKIGHDLTTDVVSDR